jgi:PilZ domain
MLMLKLRAGAAKLHRILSECRSSPRKPYDATVQISWCDKRGRITHAQARCLDWSDSGARITYHEPITPEAQIEIRTDDDLVLCSGQVRHCTQQASKYNVGIEFSKIGRSSLPQ